MIRGTSVQSRSNGSTPIRVLMADPDESLPPVYREPLSREGFELGTAVSGLECVARLRERVPDVLVLEPQLPWGGGDGVLAMMGEVPQLATVPVMVLTSCHDPHVLNRVARFPVSSYHLKPLAPDRLAARLRTLLTHPDCVSLWRNKPVAWNLRSRGEPAVASGTCVSRPLTDASLCAAAPTHTTSSNWRWPLCGRRLKPRNLSPKGSSWTLKSVEQRRAGERSTGCDGFRRFGGPLEGASKCGCDSAILRVGGRYACTSSHPGQ